MPKKTIETDTVGWTNVRGSSYVDLPVPPDTPVTVTYDAPEVEIAAGQRWKLNLGEQQWRFVADAGETWLLFLSCSTICREESKAELQTWLNENATIEEDGK